MVIENRSGRQSALKAKDDNDEERWSEIHFKFDSPLPVF